MNKNLPSPPPIADTAGKPSAGVRRDLKLEPLIDLSIEEAKKEKRR